MDQRSAGRTCELSHGIRRTTVQPLGPPIASSAARTYGDRAEFEGQALPHMSERSERIMCQRASRMTEPSVSEAQA